MSSDACLAERFSISVGEDVLDDLRRRLEATRWTAEETEDWTDGTSPRYLRELVAHWREGFDWRAQQAAINRFDHFRAVIDATKIRSEISLIPSENRAAK